MSYLLKVTTIRYVDSQGKRVSKGTPGSQAVKGKSRKWYGRFKDPNGKDKQVPLFTDKTASQAKLNEIVRNVERRSAGLYDPYEEHHKKSVNDHLADYEAFMIAKGITEKHVNQTLSRIRKLIEGCQINLLMDIDATKVAVWLSDRRMTSKRFSAQTSNFYLDGLKYFCNWLVTHDRMQKNPVSKLNRVNIEIDQRHTRRSLSEDEFQRLISAAEDGSSVENVNGPDRAIIYLFAAWTGFRRRELASMTLRSIDLTGTPPVLKVDAAYSKRRREDSIPLHPYVVGKFRYWLKTQPDLKADSKLFPLTTPKGYLRDTAKMMKKDLESARKLWLDESSIEAERTQRESSDFLKYENSKGEFADFHANRHTFITNLSKAGISLAVAQKLARHSDPRLTANRYTHLDIDEKASAIETLPSPKMTEHSLDQNEIQKTNPKSLVAPMVALTPVALRHGETVLDNITVPKPSEPQMQKPLSEQGFSKISLELSADGKIRPEGFEPPTLGSEDRCSIQLSHGRYIIKRIFKVKKDQNSIL